MKILLVIYDNESYMSYFPMGPAYLAAYARREGFSDITVYSQDYTHAPDAELTEYLRTHRFDVVGIGVIGGYFQYRKLLGLAQAINAVPNRPFFVLGGHGPSPEPEYFLRKTQADAVVIGEGEIVFTNLLKALAAGRPLREVAGLAFWEGDRVVVNPREPLIKDIDSLPFPAWDLFPMDYYTLIRIPCVRPTERCIQVITGRGCPYSCNFCYRMDPGFRPRKTESVIEELRILKREYRVTFFDFTDDLLMSSPQRVMEFCEQLIRSGLNIRFFCQGRLNFATPEVLSIMKQAGCAFINYGIESLDEAALRAMNKALTVDQIIRGVENTLAAGIAPGLNIIWGNLGETVESLRKGVEFLLKYSTTAQMRTIRPVTPYPGSPLYYEAIRRGLLEGPADFYERKHLNSDLLAVNFTDLTDDEFHRHLHEANRILLEDYFDKLKAEYRKTLDKLYFERDVTFRGFRQT